MNPARVALKGLDNLWIQVAGTRCNLSCSHCFNDSGPASRAFGLLPEAGVLAALAEAARRGAREIFFTGGEPFLHPGMPDFLSRALKLAPATVLTNGTLIDEALAVRLSGLQDEGPYSLEIRLSLDGPDRESNDRLRGAGVFDAVMSAAGRLSARGLLPLVTVVRTWAPADEARELGRFASLLRSHGCARPRLKVLPRLPLGRGLAGAGPEALWGPPSARELAGFDLDLLMCSNSRVVTDRGVWVCPLLVGVPEARLGADLAGAAGAFELSQPACRACLLHGALCGNLNSLAEGPSLPLKEAR